MPTLDALFIQGHKSERPFRFIPYLLGHLYSAAELSTILRWKGQWDTTHLPWRAHSFFSFITHTYAIAPFFFAGFFSISFFGRSLWVKISLTTYYTFRKKEV